LSSEPRAPAARAAGPHRRHSAPVRLGLTLRSVLLVPRDGFAAAIRTAERRARAGERLAEGTAPYVLAAAGGAGAMMAWLKVGALAGWRSAAAARLEPGVLPSAVVLGALLGVAAQLAWGAAGPPLAARLGGGARPRDLRLVWGASGLPQTFALAVLLPGDLVIVGPAAFTSDPLRDPVATMWAALSIALGLALVVWSAWIFVRGVEVATGLEWRRAIVMGLWGALCAGVLVAALTLVALAASS
jgi:hypothetical protein